MRILFFYVFEPIKVWHGVAPLFECGTMWHVKPRKTHRATDKKKVIFLSIRTLIKNVARWHGGTQNRPWPNRFCEIGQNEVFLVFFKFIGQIFCNTF